jgi:hypothetical protein
MIMHDNSGGRQAQVTGLIDANPRFRRGSASLAESQDV